MITFSIVSTPDPFTITTDLQAFSYVLASFFALGQMIQLLSKRSKYSSALWVFFLVPLIPHLVNMYTIQIEQPPPMLARPQDHPVQKLVQKAKENFQELIQKQSKTYEAAHEEYRRRYGLEPPAGFEAWFEFAMSHESPIIDEFDLIHENITPFMGLSGQEFLEKLQLVQNLPGSDLWLCEFSGQEARVVCSHPFRVYDRHIGHSFDRLLRGIPGRLPDIKFLVNHIDEPRVLIPRREDAHSSGTCIMDNLSRQPVFDILTRFCSSSEINKTRGNPGHEIGNYGLPFVSDPASAINLCQHPEYNSMHGLLMRPASFPLLEGLVPILSTGSLSTMGDILYPSPAYLEDEFQYAEANDIEWVKKRNNLYWAGSNTGGFASGNQWQHFHRQRFVELAQNLNKRQHSYLRDVGGILSRVKSSFLNSRLFDVAFTRIFQCEARSCREQRSYFNLKPWEDKDRALGSRLVFDLDGNGISGRYYNFLASRSAPLKQSLLREWHDERLVPWLHYIPVSQSMDELPELVSHLTSTGAGREAARHVADEGREWFSRAFREVDRSIYVYRLLLEMGRLQDPARPRIALDG
jgi:hypothetical protein